MSFQQRASSPSLPPLPITFSSTFDLLGPFQSGTREAAWGADPLEYHGGFHSLHPSPEATFHSSLTTKGTVKWSTLQASVSSPSSKSITANLLVEFPDVDWENLKAVYGWAALQYQAWTRGTLTVAGDKERTVVLYTDQVLEFWIDNEHYFGGDFYEFRKAPLVLHLEPGEHVIDVRIVREVRAMGGVGEPTVSIGLEAGISEGGLKAVDGSLLLPDLVEGKLTSSLGSISVRNEGKDWIEVVSLQSVNGSHNVSAHAHLPCQLAPGQTRPLAFDLAVSNPPLTEISVSITYKLKDSCDEFRTPAIRQFFTPFKIDEPQKITYLHPGGVVSYAILRPPKRVLHDVDPTSNLPVVLGLHGAGVDGDSDEVRHTFDEATNLRGWVLLPSGVTPWSGDDWHRWGIADIEAAVAAIPQWITTMEWHGVGVDTERWLVTGHSNGGQGVWYVLTHRPDKILGAAPVSGYSSIQAYVPYQFWHEADPRITAILQSSLWDYRHELLLSNSCGIPIHLQHGSSDDNVPPIHSRRMSLLLSQAGCSSEYTELPGKDHYFEGIMTTRNLLDFYDNLLDGKAADQSVFSSFSFVVANPATMGAKGGIIVDQLTSSGFLGKVEATFVEDTRTWLMNTSNIHRLHFAPAAIDKWMGANIFIDGFGIQLFEGVSLSSQWLVHQDDGSWKVCRDLGWLRDQRHGHQSGGLLAILGTRGRLFISTPSKAFPLAVQISRNLFQYFGADALIIDPDPDDQPGEGNRISLLLGFNNDVRAGQFGAITIDERQGLVVLDAHGHANVYGFQEGLGAIFLRPGVADTLDLVVWGSDLSGLRHAARLIPTLTGIGQPDFVVHDKQCAWKGAAGVLTLGFFDNYWNISKHSVVL